jgi:protein tyrosine/serine phosphatase
MIKKNKVVLLVLLAILAIASTAIVRHRLGPFHFKTVTPGVLYRSGSLSNYNLDFVADRYRIRSIVSLRLKNESAPQEHWYKMEKSFCEARGIKFFHIPMLGNRPPTDEQLEKWLDIVSDQANHPILLHCAQGVTRTGVMVAVYQIEFRGDNNKRVWEDMPRFGRDFDTPKRQAIKNYILNYQPRRHHRGITAD